MLPVRANSVSSLYFPTVKICATCDLDERCGKRKDWATHPEVAQFEQETGKMFLFGERNEYNAVFVKANMLGRPLRSGEHST